MLALDDPRWASLSHAYGSAINIPALIKDLRKSTEPKVDYSQEPWFSLWSSLCHQGDAYEASYAALPHIVDIGCEAVGPIDFSFFQLPAAIEIARQKGSGPTIPSDLWDAYSKGLSRIMECVSIHRNEVWDQSTLLSALIAQAVAKGHCRVAEAIMNLDEELITKLIDLDFQS